MAGKIIADTIQAAGDRITFNVGEVTVMTANSAGLTYIPSANVNLNIANPSSITVGNLTATGNISLTGTLTNGIKFPATQVSSADANTLDDYEEGTWTPVVYFGANTQTRITGTGYDNHRYTKIGRVVYFSSELYFSKSSGTGAFSIAGLPFTVSGGRQNQVSWYPQFVSSTFPAGNLYTYFENGTTTINAPGYMTGSSGTQSTIVDTHFASSSNYMYVAGWYITS